MTGDFIQIIIMNFRESYQIRKKTWEESFLDLSGKEDEEFKLKREEFVKKYYKWLDGNSAKRVYETIVEQ